MYGETKLPEVLVSDGADPTAQRTLRGQPPHDSGADPDPLALRGQPPHVHDSSADPDPTDLRGHSRHG